MCQFVCFQTECPQMLVLSVCNNKKLGTLNTDTLQLMQNLAESFIDQQNLRIKEFLVFDGSSFYSRLSINSSNFLFKSTNQFFFFYLGTPIFFRKRHSMCTVVAGYTVDKVGIHAFYQSIYSTQIKGIENFWTLIVKADLMIHSWLILCTH